MTTQHPDAPMVNGRVTQRDLYDAIGRLDTKLDGHYHKLDDRLRHVELALREERAHDDERELMIREQHEIKLTQGASRRWLIGITVTVILSASASLTSVLLSMGA